MNNQDGHMTISSYEYLGQQIDEYLGQQIDTPLPFRLIFNHETQCLWPID